MHLFVDNEEKCDIIQNADNRMNIIKFLKLCLHFIFHILLSHQQATKQQFVSQAMWLQTPKSKLKPHQTSLVLWVYPMLPNSQLSQLYYELLYYYQCLVNSMAFGAQICHKNI